MTTIDPYDQETIDYLVAAGVSLQLVERVNRMAKDSAAWKKQCERYQEDDQQEGDDLWLIRVGPRTAEPEAHHE